MEEGAGRRLPRRQRDRATRGGGNTKAIPVS